MKKLIAFLLILSPSLFSITLPYSKNEYCNRFKDKSLFQKLSEDKSNLISFQNDGGIFNLGTCWWHTRFQRNAFYNVIFKPNEKKPTIFALKKIIEEIREGKNIVVIPGFKYFSEFSFYHKNMIQLELNAWQIYDGIVNASWIEGLKGNTTIDSNELSEMMMNLHRYTNYEYKMGFTKLQIEGITSHAWLIIGSQKIQNGLIISYIDSNDPQLTQKYTYHFGENSFYTKDYGHFIPYLTFKREEKRLENIGLKYCGLINDDSLIGDEELMSKENYQKDLEEFNSAGKL
jgi:hypothetical protein